VNPSGGSTRVETIISYPEFDACLYEGWNFNSGNYLFTADTK